MSLKNIQLPPIVISKLYHNYLVDINLVDINNDKKKTEIAKSDNLLLGGNDKNILLLVNNIEVAFLTDNQLEFLSSILSACKLNLADVAIINLNKTDEKEIFEFFKASKIIA